MYFFLANTHKKSKSERERLLKDLSRMLRLLSKDNYNFVNVNARKKQNNKRKIQWAHINLQLPTRLVVLIHFFQ